MMVEQIGKTEEVIQDFVAPGHVYNPETGNGIEWLPKTARLWIKGVVTKEVPHTTTSAYEFWYNLTFADVFPSVTHWWFGGGWTGKIRISSPINPELGDEYYTGLIQFFDDQGPSLPWTASEGVNGALDLIYTPMPPSEVVPINLPLRILLGQLVWDVMFNDVPRNYWMIVSSGVRRQDLEKALPLEWSGWRLEHIVEPPRQAFCLIMGLEPSES